MTSIVKIDRSKLPTKYNEVEVDPKLIDFLAQVQLAKPLVNFVAHNHHSYTETIHTPIDDKYEQKTVFRGVKVFENGEELGSLFVGKRCMNGGRVDVFEVSSFRISKMRGDENTTVTSNIKVALRKIKKLFIGRADQELIGEIAKTIRDRTDSLHGEYSHEVSWSFDDDGEGMNYALLGYLARLKGESTISLPVIPATVKDQKKYLTACSNYYESKEMVDGIKNDKGYGVLLRPDGAYIIYSYATKTLARYKSFTDMPTDFQTKLGVFKLLKSAEMCQFGVMFKPEQYMVEKYPNTYFYLKE